MAHVAATVPVISTPSNSTTSAAAATVEGPTATDGGAAAREVSPNSSIEELATLSSTSLDYDSDGPEVCALVADPSGDIQVGSPGCRCVALRDVGDWPRNLAAVLA
jgi:hypothetical protein